MTAVRLVDRVVGTLVLVTIGWALVSGLGRVPERLLPAPGAFPTQIHTVLALVAALGGALAALRLLTGPGGQGRGSDFIRQFRKNRTAVLGFYGVCYVALVASLAPLLAPEDPIRLDRDSVKLAVPGALAWLGTDALGRDVWSRCLYGARVSLTVGLLAVTISVTVGTFVGSVSAYFGGIVDRGLMWFTDLLLAMPRLILLIAIVGVTRPPPDLRIFVLVTVLGATGWMAVARIVRSQVLAQKQLDYVAAAVSLGLRPGRILVRHILPNVLAPVIVYASLALGGTILTEAALSYLAMGVPAPTPTWGQMIQEGMPNLRDHPRLVLIPGAFIVISVLSLNLLGDGIRDALDPKLRGRA